MASIPKQVPKARAARRKHALSPQEYVDAITFYSKQTTARSLYPGYLFEDLSLFLQDFSENTTPPYSTDLKQSGGIHSLATVFTLKFGEVIRRSFSSPVECIAALGEASQIPHAHILFLSGYPTSEWIARVGAFCHVEPDFFNKHLRFRCRRDYFSSTSLPSSSKNMVTLRFVTIGSREAKRGDSTQEVVDRLRAEGEKAMHKYEHALMVGMKLGPGDSIVREYRVLDEKHFFIEQDISICINKMGKDWITLICSDAGNDLTEGPPGPWLTDEDRNSHPWTMFYPTIQKRPHIALELRANPDTDDKSFIGQRKFPQSAALLIQDYGKLLDKQLMSLDPFYATNELFRFCASSDAQLLDILKSTINTEIDRGTLSMESTPTLTTLLYCQKTLESLLPRLQQNTSAIKKHSTLWWPLVTDENRHQHAKAVAAAESLLEDLEHLESLTKDLLERCRTGMNVLMNYVMLAESRQAMLQGQRLAKLTLLAFLYIPLSFTTSFFGMNITQIVNGDLSIWVWFTTSVPVFGFSVLFFYIDFKKLAAVWKVGWKRFKMMISW